MRWLWVFIFVSFLGQLSAELDLKTYGYVRLDPIYGSRNFGGYPTLIPRLLPLDTNKAADHPELLIDARHTRIGLRAKEVWNEIKLRAQIEADFQTKDGTALETNSRHFRLRLAYFTATLPSGFFFLLGQYWTLFKNTEYLEPKLCDYFGPVGAKYGRRQPQMRLGYKYKGEDNDFIFRMDFEQHSLNTLGVVDPTTQTDTNQGSGQKFPLLSSKVSWRYKHLLLEASGAVAQSDVTLDEKGKEATKVVYGVNVHAYLRFKWFAFFASAHHIYGLTRLTGEDFPDLVLDTTGHLRAVTSNSWYFGGLYKITKSTTFHAIYSWEKAEPISHTTFDGDARGRFQSLHVNVMHRFWERLQVALEFQRDTTKTFNGIHGQVNIWHGAFWYFF